MTEEDEDASLNVSLDDLRTRVNVQGDLRRKTTAVFEEVQKRLAVIDVRLARIEEKQIPRAEIVAIVNTENRPMAKEVEFLARAVWGLASALIVSFAGAIVAMIFTKLTGAPGK